MKLLYQIIDHLGVLLDAGLIVYLVNRYFTPRHEKLRGILWYVLSTAGVVCFLYFLGYSRSFFWFVSSIFASFALYVFVFFRGAVYRKLSMCCIYGTLYIVTDSIYMPLYNQLIQSMGTEPPFLQILMILFRRVICKGIMFLLIRFLLHNEIKNDAAVPRSFVTCMMVFCGFDVMILLLNIFYMQGEKSASEMPAAFVSIFMAVCFALILSFYYLFTSMIKSYQENISSRLQVKEEGLHEQYLEQAQDLIQASRKFRHDMKNHFFCMQGLLEQQQYEELGKYLEQFGQDNFLHLPFQAYCGDDSINTILNQKARQAAEAKIPMKLEVQLSNQFAVQKIDLCTLIANLCDNAIEAEKSVKDPEITLELKESKGYISLKVCNHTEGNVLDKNPVLKTTKEDVELHGLGMGIVRNIVEKYNGMMDVSCDEEIFCCYLLLENE